MNMGTSGLTLAGKGEAADVRINSYDSKEAKRREENSGCGSANGGRPRRIYQRNLEMLCTTTQLSPLCASLSEKLGKQQHALCWNASKTTDLWMPEIVIEPESVVRDSTGPAPTERTVAHDASFAADHA